MVKTEFDPDNPPETFREFRKQILHSIEELEVEEDETWPPALFLVCRNGDAGVKYISDIVEESEGEMSVEIILEQVLPGIIKATDGKFYALVLPGQIKTITDDSSDEILTILMGDFSETEMLVSKVHRYEDNLTELDAWEKQNVLNFSELVIPYRRAITLQG